MILSQATWLSYLLVAFFFLPVIFYLRYRNTPFAVPVFPKNKYDFIEHLYAWVYITYTVALFFLPVRQSKLSWLGIALLVFGVLLQTWAVWSLGKNWRIGQKARDASCEFVTRGPFRIIRHPIYLSIIAVVVGQMLIVGINWRSVLLLISTLLYVAIQGYAESKHWCEEKS